MSQAAACCLRVLHYISFKNSPHIADKRNQGFNDPFGMPNCLLGAVTPRSMDSKTPLELLEFKCCPATFLFLVNLQAQSHTSVRTNVPVSQVSSTMTILDCVCLSAGHADHRIARAFPYAKCMPASNQDLSTGLSCIRRIDGGKCSASLLLQVIDGLTSITPPGLQSPPQSLTNRPAFELRTKLS